MKKVFIVLVSSEVGYDNLQTDVIAVKTSRKSAEKLVAEKKAHIKKSWKNLWQDNVEVTEDTKGCFSVYNDAGDSYQVLIVEKEIED